MYIMISIHIIICLLSYHDFKPQSYHNLPHPKLYVLFVLLGPKLFPKTLFTSGSRECIH